ncbi:MAG: hypothetical protein V1750_01300 [Acidobacteriota bacterium]
MGDLSDYLLGLAAREAGAGTTYTFDRGFRGEEQFTALGSRVALVSDPAWLGHDELPPFGLLIEEVLSFPLSLRFCLV